MKIIVWNVNGIRAALKKGLVDFLQKEKPNVVCFQETKAFAHQAPPELRMLPYPTFCRHAGQRAGYAGTAILSDISSVAQCNVFEHSVKFHEDGRMTQLEFDDFFLLNIYFPNGWTRADGTEMLSYKLAFYDELASYLKTLDKPYILVGDFNICHTEIDIARPEANKKSIWFLPEERKRIGDFMEETDVVDIFRHFQPDAIDEYTRRSYRAGARQRNVWRRIDYAMVHKSLVSRVKSFRHRQDVMGSDHCPIELILE